MKTYPFLRILISLFTLLLIILTGCLAFLIFDPLFADPVIVKLEYTTTSPPKSGELPSELLTTISTGKKLFKNNCANCHNKDMKSRMTGPALGGVRERWSDYPISDLYDWIRNPIGLVEKGHPRAVAVFTEWNRIAMTPFSNLSDEEIAAILTYIESVE